MDTGLRPGVNEMPRKVKQNLYLKNCLGFPLR